MKAKTWLILLLSGIILSLAVFAGLMFRMDPLLHYGRENPALTYYEYGEMYSNPGIAKHYTYDSVLVGTSMVENTDVDLFEELFGCDLVRLPYSGGTTYNMKTILDVCFASGNAIKTVYWELDEFQLTGSADAPRYPLPDYLYRYDHREDLSYLLNLDIFYHYGMNSILGTLAGNVQPAERRGEMLTGNFSREQVLNTYHRPEQKTEAYIFSGSRMEEKTRQNLQNITGLLESHPNTEFVFFLPPFSVLYWDRELASNTFDATLDSLLYAAEQLLSYENVTLYFYHNEQDIITNLENYKDYSHYSPEINNTLTRYMAQDRNRLTKDNYKSMVEAFRSFIHSFDFKTLYS